VETAETNEGLLRRPTRDKHSIVVTVDDILVQVGQVFDLIENGCNMFVVTVKGKYLKHSKLIILTCI